MQKRYSIVYEDDRLMVIDKPPGLLVIPTPRMEANTLTGLVNKDLDSRGIQVNAHPCHRLDRDTSGLIIYAKGKAVQQAIMDQFRTRLVKKIYVAFVNGIIKKEFDTISGSIYNRNKSKAEEALTRYKVLERRGSFTVVEVEPVTGRTNQIRIHMRDIGHPLVGERVYAFRRDYELRFKRAALHARHIEFNDPAGGRKMSFDSPLPDDMAGFLKETR